MCFVKTGKDVKTSGDLQNLVTSAVLRQIGIFDEKAVRKYTLERLNGSTFENHSDTIDSLIKSTLKTLSQDDTVVFHSDGYKVQDLVAF